jgi:hypothetical protein
MRPCRIVVAVAVILAAYATAEAGGDAKDLDMAPILETVLRHEFPKPNEKEHLYLFIQFKDPDPKLLEKMNKAWPMLKPGSKVPDKGQPVRVSVSDLNVTARGEALELLCGVANGIDGVVKRYWLKKKDGKWTVEKTVIEAIS